MSERDIDLVLEAHIGPLMAIPGVVGVARGALEDGTPCIMVLVVELTETLERRLPEELAGHPIRITESGEIKPL